MSLFCKKDKVTLVPNSPSDPVRTGRFKVAPDDSYLKVFVVKYFDPSVTPVSSSLDTDGDHTVDRTDDYGFNLIDLPSISFCHSASQADEAIDRFLFCSHYSHFIAWCSLRHLDSSLRSSWSSYSDSCITDEERDSFVVLTLYYSLPELIAILRQAATLPPLGCSFEDPYELQCFSDMFHSDPSSFPSSTSSFLEAASHVLR